PELERQRDSQIRANSSYEEDSESKTSALEKAEAITGSNSKQVSRNSANRSLYHHPLNVAAEVSLSPDKRS
ncbi:hypothetical protein Ancab_011491, partial [Ancistrocladus abbreviatus]